MKNRIYKKCRQNGIRNFKFRFFRLKKSFSLSENAKKRIVQLENHQKLFFPNIRKIVISLHDSIQQSVFWVYISFVKTVQKNHKGVDVVNFVTGREVSENFDFTATKIALCYGKHEKYERCNFVVLTTRSFLTITQKLPDIIFRIEEKRHSTKHNVQHFHCSSLRKLLKTTLCTYW